jgi:membrane protein
MNVQGGDAGVGRLRAFASRVVERLGGIGAVRTMRATLAVFDAAGGGLVAGGLAYAALVALLPGLLLALSGVGLVVHDTATRDRLVATIGDAVPPLASLARLALEQVSTGAVPTGILALLVLLWGSSRFYAALDNAFARIFNEAPRRNGIERSIRGLLVTVLFVALPLGALVVGSVVSWVLDLAPGAVNVSGVGRAAWRVVLPLVSIVLYVAVTALVYRFVPAGGVPAAAFRRPAIVAGLALGVFTQVFTFVAPRLVGVATLYGTFVAAFALLAWLSIAFNVLLLGGAWARVRARALGDAAVRGADPSGPAGSSARG